MTTWIALLRGINVGGRRKLPMAALRASLEGAGYSDVATYIQSGNVVLTSDDGAGAGEDDSAGDGDGPTVAGALAALIERDFGYDDVPVVTRTADQWAAAMAANPFPEAEATPKQLFVYFCASPPGSDLLEGFDHDRYSPDRLAAPGAEIYVAYDVGMSKSKLDSAAVERSLGVTATARNWSTVLKLATMIGLEPR